MTHQDLIDHITRRADALGLIWHYCQDSRHCSGGTGLPDLIIISPNGNGIIWCEVKTENATALSNGQMIWKYSLIANGAKWLYFMPIDLDTGRIEYELKEIR